MVARGGGCGGWGWGGEMGEFFFFLSLNTLKEVKRKKEGEVLWAWPRKD